MYNLSVWYTLQQFIDKMSWETINFPNVLVLLMVERGGEERNGIGRGFKKEKGDYLLNWNSSSAHHLYIAVSAFSCNNHVWKAIDNIQKSKANKLCILQLLY